MRPRATWGNFSNEPDEFITDGGELHVQAIAIRNRVSDLAMVALLTGALAPTFAAFRTIFSHLVWTALAFCFAFFALVLTVMLHFANRHLCVRLDEDRRQRAIAKHQREILASRKPLDEKLLERDPNIHGYMLAGESRIANH